ncbi:sporulation protein [Caldinitratiruptor microaerophilus]|uniref:Sporulation protein n=1 Tax=Caldinitratiruptor microaerophilus TaxID=671077 RepID=A0AA35CKI0_9FIRM|nr:sporulation protein [Caldinitratiruptor microaerophilus]
MRVGKRRTDRRLVAALGALALGFLAVAGVPAPRARAESPRAPAAPGDVAPAGSLGGPAVRVGIGRALLGAELRGTGGLVVLDPSGREIARAGPGQPVRFRAEPVPGAVGPPGGPAVAVRVEPPDGGAHLLPGPVRAVPAGTGASDGGAIVYEGRRYRGEAEVLPSAAGGRLSVVNVVGVEDYLRGVLPREMPVRSFPPEALKAQAVVSRTFALKAREEARFRAEGFDVTADTSSQLYGGMDVEEPEADAAALATRGQVILYQGRLIAALFHAQSGGHTEDNEVVFTGGRPLPYLRGVPDFDQDAPRYRWEVVVDAGRLGAALRDGYQVDVGEILGVEPAGTRGSGGRWSHWRVWGTRGSAQVTGSQMRWALGLPSNPRELTVERTAPGTPARGYAAAERLIVLGAAGALREASAGGLVLAGAAEAAASGPSGTAERYAAVPEGGFVALGGGGEVPVTLRAAGGGYGHGVGLSQWGARALALAGKTYVEIIQYYFTGVEVAAYGGP